MNISAPRLDASTQYQVAVAKQIQASTEDLNQSALQLIEASGQTAPAPSATLGTRIDVRA